MPSASHDEYPGFTSFEPVALDELENPLVVEAVAYWRGLCRGRRFPARTDLDQRALEPFQSHMILLKVVGDGEDFEYRFVGSAQVKAYARQIEGKRMKALAETSPGFGPAVFAGYVYIQKTGMPFAIRGWAGEDYVSANFLYCESVTLPLGDRDDFVDHLAVFSAYVPRGMEPKR